MTKHSVGWIPFEDLVVKDRLGLGAAGEVYLGLYLRTPVAIKKLFAHVGEGDREHDGSKATNALENFFKEVTLMSKLSHPNILLFIGVCVRDNGDRYIITEMMDRGSVFDLIHPNFSFSAIRDPDADIRLTPERIYQILLQSARGMAYLHAFHPPIIHRDLKSHNLLVDRFWNVKVADFGLSRPQSDTMTAAGTPQWSAPEVLRQDHYTIKADVYSFSIIIYELLSRKIPYVELGPLTAAQKVGYCGLRPTFPSSSDPTYVNLAVMCWDENPELRPTFPDIIRRLENMQPPVFIHVNCRTWMDLPQKTEGVEFTRFHTIRQNRVRIVIEQVEQFGCLLIRSAPVTGKTTLAKCIHSQSLQYNLTSFLYTPLSFNESFNFRHFLSLTSPSLIIIDDAQLIFNTHMELWHVIKYSLQEKLNPSVFFVLFSSTEDRPMINDELFQFPKIMGSGALLYDEQEQNELFDSFSKITNINLTEPLRNYLTFLTNGHIGQLVSILNGLLNPNHYTKCKATDNISVEQSLFSWFSSYNFYLYLLTCKGFPVVTQCSPDEIKILQQLLETHCDSDNNYQQLLRLPDVKTFKSLIGKYIIRHADEKLGMGLDASFGLDCTFSSTLTFQLVYYEINKHILNDTFWISKSIIEDLYFIVEKTNPKIFQNSSGCESNLPWVFCKEFYKNSTRIKNSFTFIDFASTNFKCFNKIDFYISANEKIWKFTLCSNLFTENQQESSTYFPFHEEIILYLHFPSENTDKIDIVEENTKMIQNLYEIKFSKDYSGVRIIKKENNQILKEIIFRGHLPFQENFQESISLSNTLLTHESRLHKLFVGQIPKNLDESHLRPLFEGFGCIYELAIIRDKQTNDHKGCAFISYYSREAAEHAIEQLHNKHQFPRQKTMLQVKFASAEQHNAVQEYKLFIGMIPPKFSEDDLHSLFVKYGAIEELAILRDSSGESKCCGFIKYSSRSAAISAITSLNRTFVVAGSSNPLVVKFAEPNANKELPHSNIRTPLYPRSIHIPGQNYKSSTARKAILHSKQGPDGCNLFIHRIPPLWTDYDLVNQFYRFGSILSANVFIDKETGKSKCFGFVSFDNPSSARLAVSEMDGLKIGGTKLLVQLKRGTNNPPY